MTAVSDLADDLVRTLLAANPFEGTGLGLREYDALLSDPSAEAGERLDRELAAFADRAAALDAAGAERVTLEAVRSTITRRRQALAMEPAEYTVSAMPLYGPPALFGVLARTTIPDATAAEAFLTRLRGSGAWIDAGSQRLREGAEGGRLPIRSLTEQAVVWADRALAAGVPGALTAATWDFADERDEIVRSTVMPALARWRDLLVDLLPRTRDDEHAGICHLPGGEDDYLRAIEYHTTLPFTAQELHDIGLAEIARLEARAAELGASIGLTDLADVVRAVRESSAAQDAQAALAASRTAVARAEAEAHRIMPAPLPAPCAVEPMPPSVAESGMPPHYTRPMTDGSRPGTYWFNTARPTAGTGWDLEAVVFHETVPGHHSQLARLQHLDTLPLLQQLSVTVHSEGWGLYAERLAGEFGLYSDVRAEIGAVYIEMHRAARLVVDTGLHAFGWSRSRALGFMVEHVALPAGFLADEIDRYLAWPGQALAYLTGQREILRLRAAAETRLGDRFDLPAFHAAVLDSGSLPMPALAAVVEEWVVTRA